MDFLTEIHIFNNGSEPGEKVLRTFSATDHSRAVGKHLMKIVNTNNLKVERLGLNKYLTWISVVYILFVPKIIFELDDNGKVKNINVVGFIKSLFLNFTFIFGIFLVYMYFKKIDLSRITDFAPFLIGILVFLILINFIIIGTTKRIVNNQIE